MLQYPPRDEIKIVEKDQGAVNDRSCAQTYLNLINRQAERVLSLMDREPFSLTFGCLDRTYWAWKFTDFPGARFQEGLCVLSFLYTTPFENNRYYGRPKLLEWIAGGFDFWTHIQYPGGDFDEAYPFERSLAATAFTAFYLSEAWNFLDGRLPADTGRRFKAALERAGDWLVANDEKHGFLSNHLAAAAAALYHIYCITGSERFEKRSRYFLDKILAHQSQEGWYEEYGGADPGYQTHGSFYLARYLELSRDSRLLDSLEQSFAFLAHFVHPDGSLGGEYSSRNTQTYYPAAFEMMSAVSGSAHWIAAAMLPSVKTLAAAGLGTVDSYNFFPLLNNYVFAYRACLEENHRTASPVAPPQESGMSHFPEAGLLKVRTEQYQLYIGLTKGGVIKAFDRQKRQLIYNDCGYIGKLKNGKLLSNQWLEKERTIEIEADNITVAGSFYQIKKLVMRPVPFLGFRAFSLTLGRLPQLSYWLKSILVKALIYRKRDLDLWFTRRIMLQPDAFTVLDHIQGSIGSQIETLTWGDLFTTIHMGSSRYFVPNDLNGYEPEQEPAGETLNLKQLEQGVSLQRTVSIK